jgi:hypothetical protein
MVLLGDTSEEDVRNQNGYSVYVIATDKPLLQGILKANIGFAKVVHSRVQTHFNDGFGSYVRRGINKQDQVMAEDIKEKVYVWVLKTGIKTEQEARELEAVYQAQYGLDMCGDKDAAKYCDFTYFFKNWPSAKAHSYNIKIDQKVAIERERKNILDNKYSFCEEMLRLIRVAEEEDTIGVYDKVS